MRIIVLAAFAVMCFGCTFDGSALGWTKDAGIDPDSNQPDRTTGDSIRDSTRADSGHDSQTDAGQDDAGQTDTLIQPDLDTHDDAQVQSDSAVHDDAQIQSDASPDAKPTDPCVGLVANYTGSAGMLDHCNDGHGHSLPNPDGNGDVHAPNGVCYIICYLHPEEVSGTELPVMCTGNWDIGVGGPVPWSSMPGCQNLPNQLLPYLRGCSSDRSCLNPKYP